MLSATALAVLGIQAPAQAAAPAKAAAPANTPAPASSTNHSADYQPACGTPAKGDFTCFALFGTDTKRSKGLLAGATAPDGYGPADLRSAYHLPDNGGAGQTIAIVDAFDDPNAEADLGVYRKQYGLPACTADNGCFRKVSQRGGSDLPPPDDGWAGEISLDLDMVSAAAPDAHILLIEADSTDVLDLGAGVDEAVSLGARFVSNSYGTDYRSGGGEDPSETTQLDAHYNHPGVAVVASSGDYGYGVSYPAASQYVTSVGGTSLISDPGTSRGWSETAWDGAGSGCSLYEPKPAFQQDTGCNGRTVADVSAVADPGTPVSVYLTYGSLGGGWGTAGGTSAAAPIITSVYADAGTPAPGTYPNAYPYETSGAGINDANGGNNGACYPTYLCTGTAGYDAPTGVGTPNGLAAFRTGPHGQVTGTVTDSGSGKPVAGVTVSAGDASATTDAAGSYSLTLPAGSWDITAGAFGYATGTAKAVAVVDGQELTKNFALSPVPSRTISGKVTDGSGHGWPLYAKITVDGVPGGPVWTDPATGAYSVTLPRGHDYTLHIDATLPGYQEVTRSVTAGSSPSTVNVPMTSDPWQATTPGYTVHLDGPTETFDSTGSAPQGWRVADADGSLSSWEFDDPAQRGNHTGGDGAFAVIESPKSFDGIADTQLISPAFDLSGTANPELAFNTWIVDGTQTTQVDVTDDGGATWTNVWAPVPGTNGQYRIEVPLTGFTGQKAVQVRFHYAGSFGSYWGIDNVFVGRRGYSPTQGGLVVGTVADANTGSGLIGADVTSKDDPAVTTRTVATPDDPKLGDGYYSLFSSDLGARSLAVAKAPYTALSKTVKVRADSTARANITLKAGRVKVTPGQISASVGWGKQAKQKLTVKNTGGAPTTLTLGEQAGGTEPAAVQGAPLQRIKGNYSPLPLKVRATTTTPDASAGPSANGWQSVPDYPYAMSDNSAGTFGGKVYSLGGYTQNGASNDLYILDPSTGSWTQGAGAADRRYDAAHGFIDGKFYVAGGWGADDNPDPRTEIYDPAGNTWTTGASAPSPHAAAGTAVLDGKLYMIGGCEQFVCDTADASVYDPATDRWSRIASYPETIAWESCAGIDGRLYCAGGDAAPEGVGTPVKHTYVYDPHANSWSQLADMPIPLWGSAYTSANGRLVISGGAGVGSVTNQGFAFDPQTGAWSTLPNATSAGYRDGSALGFYKFGGLDSDNGAGSTVERLPGYDQQDRTDVSWLSESAEHLTLRAGESRTVTVDLNSAVPEVTQPGDYRAQLAFSSDTPYVIPHTAVALHVDAPKAWGTATGTVRGARAHGGSVPLAGATVRITGPTATHTLTTDADGRYTLALPADDHPVTFHVSADGYQPVVAGARLKKGTTLTRDFTLHHT